MTAALKVAGVALVGVIVLYSQRKSLEESNDTRLKSAFYSLWGLSMILWVMFLLEIRIPSLSRVLSVFAKQYFA